MPQLASVEQPPSDQLLCEFAADVAAGRSTGSLAEVVAPSELPFYEEVLDWLTRTLRPVGLPRPFCKRLAATICGLVQSRKATLGEVTTAIEGLAVSPAKPESIARRLQRIFQDSRLDPSLLSLIFRPLLPELLQSHRLAHRANSTLPTFHHQRFVGVVILVDESSKLDEVHLVVAGVPIGAVVLPLAVRTWAQNIPLPDGDYWSEVFGLLAEIQAMIPPELREHVLLTADRAFGVPRMLDLLSALGWHWLLRVQGSTLVRLQNGTCYPLKTLVPRPGTYWSSGLGTAEATNEANADGSGNRSESVGVFKTAGWRDSQVVAIWAEGQTEPWALVTSLTASEARVAEYAQRWAIERLFLSWKSHGWDVEQSGIRDPHTLGRLLTAIALATLWRLAMALPRAFEHLTDLARRASRSPRQLSLPGFGAPPRPWAAKYSLLTWGWKVAQKALLPFHTPALCWHLPSWEGRSWADTCRLVYLTTHGQFPISP